MKSVVQMSVVVVSLLSLVGCGIAENAEKTLRQTEEMNKKMDQTNQKMDQTNAKMDVTNAGMEKTNKGVHIQTLKLALDALIDSKNTEVLTPPTDIIDAAEKFSEEASSLEIIQKFHLLYTGVLKGFEAEANGDKKIFRRQVRLTAGSAIAAFTSPEKVNEIIQEQILGEGVYFDTAYAFLMCRYNFIRDYRLKPVLSAERTPTLKLLREAKEFYVLIKQIATAGYAEMLRECPKRPTPEELAANPGMAVPFLPICKADGTIKMTIPEFVMKNKETNEVASLEDALNPVEHKGLGRAAVRKFDDKNNPKMQTPEAQELINAFK